MSRIVRINGALVEARPLPGVALFEVARVGEAGLLAEVIRIEGDKATLQVYEETAGLRLGDPVTPSGSGLVARLGPGLLGAILDGVGRPLRRVAEIAGDFVRAGAWAETIDPSRRFLFRPALKPGARVQGGDVLGSVEEQPGVGHLILVPPRVQGVLASLQEAERGPADAVGALEDGTPLPLVQQWLVREPRPVARRLLATQPLITGQRVFDLLFPVAEGGTVAVPGGFGTGKTVIEQSLAKHADADVVVFVGCGERGNEMAEALSDFARLPDPRTGRPLLERTVLIVNTSNMPVPAREASIYLGLTIAEYFRDQGKRVAVMADSISRWAEALREMGSRLREMPSEEGYPVYLGSRLGKLMERAGRVEALGSPSRNGSVTLFCAVSPPGGDFSEP
ncbi:MAG TPA: V-type ATP synthase subunit A, partial [Myxococcales bacterium]|nr:V-type ATP synthase subunit A [Myxococcales bacterium]